MGTDNDDAVTLSLPGTVADHLEEMSLDADERKAYTDGVATRHGRGWSLKLTAPLEVHDSLLLRCWVLAGGRGIESSPAERAAYRIYANRIEQARAAQSSTPEPTA